MKKVSNCVMLLLFVSLISFTAFAGKGDGGKGDGGKGDGGMLGTGIEPMSLVIGVVVGAAAGYFFARKKSA